MSSYGATHSRPSRPIDQLKIVSYFDVTNMDRPGYDLTKKRLYRVEMASDARNLDDPAHQMITVVKAFRSANGIPLYFQLQGRPELVDAAQVLFETAAALEGYQVADIPAGFTAGVHHRHGGDRVELQEPSR